MIDKIPLNHVIDFYYHIYTKFRGNRRLSRIGEYAHYCLETAYDRIVENSHSVVEDLDLLEAVVTVHFEMRIPLDRIPIFNTARRPFGWNQYQADEVKERASEKRQKQRERRERESIPRRRRTLSPISR